jgi:hypothetical protein
MLKLKTSAISLVTVVLSFAVMDGQSRQDSLVGRWRSTEVSSTGLSAIFEFHSDNQLDSSSAAISEQQFRLVGTDTIILQSKGGREQNMELEWDNPDRARIEDEAAAIFIELTRIGKILDSKNPLTGDWNTAREWNGRKYPARASFLSDGRVVWVITLRAEHGSYSVESTHIRLEIPSHPTVEGNFAVTEDRLTLPKPRGGEAAFERF